MINIRYYHTHPPTFMTTLGMHVYGELFFGRAEMEGEKIAKIPDRNTGHFVLRRTGSPPIQGCPQAEELARQDLKTLKAKVDAGLAKIKESRPPVKDLPPIFRNLRLDSLTPIYGDNNRIVRWRAVWRPELPAFDSTIVRNAPLGSVSDAKVVLEFSGTYPLSLEYLWLPVQSGAKTKVVNLPMDENNPVGSQKSKDIDVSGIGVTYRWDGERKLLPFVGDVAISEFSSDSSLKKSIETKFNSHNTDNEVISDKIAIILVNGKKKDGKYLYINDFRDYIPILTKEGYKVFDRVYNGAQLFSLVSDYQKMPGVPKTKYLLIFSHGYYGGLVGFNQDFSGLYTWPFYLHESQFSGIDWGDNGLMEGRYFTNDVWYRFMKNSFRFEAGAEICLAGCNTFTSTSVREFVRSNPSAEIHRLEGETYQVISNKLGVEKAERWLMVDLASELSAAFGGLSVICSSPRLADDGPYIISGASDYAKNDKYKRWSDGRWFKVKANFDVYRKNGEILSTYDKYINKHGITWQNYRSFELRLVDIKEELLSNKNTITIIK